ncbi:50S ribosomal protein L25/general stress protein Ctc [Allosphingosinicella flava]|uniref:Large ribosomal subunit protein bL25 n=1 Tax=Allosphingosinicella flava TaxID=2771430 RepID=A0A7T2GL84_9SPHN|nr:50S ribosomal protein L25/general stress protein Ctc [Sphingosinicella flava]QPQ55909.1 50S ribosomal protein L25/general stress protein Ctc [Sphingosinicella flava]
MSEQLQLSAETRERAGKGASRAMRREGRVPAVIYGNKEEPVSIHLEEKVLVKALNTGHFMNTVVMIDVGGKVSRTLPKDVQFHPVTDRPLHVDFYRIGEHSTVTVAVPVRFENEEAAPGIKKGGVLNIVRHEVELVCDAAEIPDDLVVDLTGYNVGDSIHISAVKLPKGAKPAIEDRDFTIATLVAPSGMKSAEGAAEAGEGGEAGEENA